MKLGSTQSRYTIHEIGSIVSNIYILYIDLLIRLNDPLVNLPLFVVKRLEERGPVELLLRSEGRHQVFQSWTRSLVSLLPLGLTSPGGAGCGKVPLNCGSS